MIKREVTINGQSLGILSPRDEEVYAVGKIAALAELRMKVTAMPSVVLRADVLAAIDGSV